MTWKKLWFVKENRWESLIFFTKWGAPRLYLNSYLITSKNRLFQIWSAKHKLQKILRWLLVMLNIILYIIINDGNHVVFCNYAQLMGQKLYLRNPNPTPAPSFVDGIHTYNKFDIGLQKTKSSWFSAFVKVELMSLLKTMILKTPQNILRLYHGHQNFPQVITLLGSRIYYSNPMKP